MTVRKKTIIIILLILSAFVVLISERIRTEHAEETILKGDMLYSQGKYEQAVNVWNEIIEQKSGHSELYQKIGRAFLKLANWNRAREYFERARSMSPEAYGVDLELIQLELLIGDLPAAEKRCLKLQEKIPDNPEFNTVYGDMMILSGDLKRAETYYRKAHLSDPGSSRYALKVAICLVAQNRQEDADTFFKLAQTLSDNSPKIIAQMAEYCILLKEYDRAETYLKQAIDMAPDDLGLKIRMAQFYFLTGKMENARTLLTELVASQQDNISFKKMLADINISLNRLAEAQSIILELKEVAGNDDPQYNLLQGKYWLFKGNPVYAASHLKTAVDAIPEFVSARYYLSVAYLAAGQKQLAENSVTRTLMYDPDHTDSQLLMADILYKKGQFDLSEGYLDKVAAKEAENYRVYMLKGLNALSLEDYDRAAIQFLKAFRLDPRSVAPLYYLGVSSEFAGRLDDAMLYYEKAIARESGLADISYRYAMLLIKTGRTDKAETFIKEIIGRHPDNAELYYIAAEIFLKNSREDRAISYIESAISRMNPPPYFYIKLAQIYGNKGDTARSISILEECLNLHPFSRDAWIVLAQVHLDSGHMEDAITILEQAEKKLSYDPEILSNLAWLYLETDSNLDMALEYARSAYEKMPLNSAIADTLGWAYYKKGSFAQASWILTDTALKEPENRWILYHLAMSLYREGKLPEALETFKRVTKPSRQKNLPGSILGIVNQHIQKLENKKDSHDVPVESYGAHSMDDKELLDFPDKFSPKDEDDILEPQWQEEKKTGY